MAKRGNDADADADGGNRELSLGLTGRKTPKDTKRTPETTDETTLYFFSRGKSDEKRGPRGFLPRERARADGSCQHQAGQAGQAGRTGKRAAPAHGMSEGEQEGTGQGRNLRLQLPRRGRGRGREGQGTTSDSDESGRLHRWHQVTRRPLTDE